MPVSGSGGRRMYYCYMNIIAQAHRNVLWEDGGGTVEEEQEQEEK